MLTQSYYNNIKVHNFLTHFVHFRHQGWWYLKHLLSMNLESMTCVSLQANIRKIKKHLSKSYVIIIKIDLLNKYHTQKKCLQ